jgi:hypothetical protein
VNKHVNAPGGEVNLAQVTGYIAKYVTKGTEATGLDLRRQATGSITTGDALLANTAAALAREYDEAGRDVLRDEAQRAAQNPDSLAA